MNEFWEKVEHYNSKLIPFAILALLFIIIFELFLHIENHTFELVVEILDYVVIAIFVVDLIFLAIHAKNIKYFFRNYWLDMVAIVPVVLIFTAVGYIFRAFSATGRFVLGQQILHETLEARKGVSALSRSQRFARYIRVGVRSIRAITKSRFFTKLKQKKPNSNRR